jgi:RecJ-like exonuclease
METYYRVEPGDRDPEDLLDPENQETEPWSGTVQGRCDKCGGSGETEHECESCSDDDADPNCPACGGKVRYMDECPACEGSGRIDDSKRDGVSVFPDEDGLYRYMLKRDADLDERCQLVKLEGEESSDEDFDADEGALLVKPSRIIESGKPDWDRIEELREELGDEVGSQADDGDD